MAIHCDRTVSRPADSAFEIAGVESLGCSEVRTGGPCDEHAVRKARAASGKSATVWNRHGVITDSLMLLQHNYLLTLKSELYPDIGQKIQGLEVVIGKSEKVIGMPILTCFSRRL